MATYTFIRGKFGRWSVPMWAGETQAFRLIRLLRAQGIKGILYQEGPLEPYIFTDIAKPYRYIDPWHYHYKGPNPKIEFESMAPGWFEVKFKEEPC